MNNNYQSQLTRRIMRRVWYSYLISLTLNLTAVYGLLFGVSLVSFLQLVSISSIINNLLNVKLGAVPNYIFETMLHGQVTVLAALGLMIFSLLSFRVRLRAPHLHINNMRSV